MCLKIKVNSSKTMRLPVTKIQVVIRGILHLLNVLYQENKPFFSLEIIIINVMTNNLIIYKDIAPIDKPEKCTPREKAIFSAICCPVVHGV